ncbi:MAG: phage head morphogenesis protein [Desulfobulbia bacterium]
MADLPSVASGVFKRPFAEQTAFFRAKLGNLVPTERWDDIEKSAHDRAFMVAGAAKADLLTGLAAAVDRSIAEGKGLEVFRKDFMAIAERNGWRGYTGDESAPRRAWRTRVIYTTNATTSYNAGREAQIAEGGYPLKVYHHNDSVEHPRPQHLAWNGTTLPVDDPFWTAHSPQNGWGCQ